MERPPRAPVPTRPGRTERPARLHKRLLFRLPDDVVEVEVALMGRARWRQVQASESPGWQVLPVGPLVLAVRLLA